jgi:hypothetical protein
LTLDCENTLRMLENDLDSFLVQVTHR